ncbi:hypothetical protein LAZ40_03225 [Cereibacter sphaeroides]|uniref:hypothetical protein n=1 Tax=Cereibacter sphaeroides TaxID=1063 RepID=UPI001F1B07AB|nr:hypothetical protein [Cereibacter sphaeroides]MCE6958067.1 hypothetical protein [Cereibacter sphaeroides]MCE6971322.1 hypothetical protein [Cereibacter sphaeroides]
MTVRIADFPELNLIAWNRDRDGVIEDAEAFDLYELNWRYVDTENMLPHEQALLARLVQDCGNGMMNV